MPWDGPWTFDLQFSFQQTDHVRFIDTNILITLYGPNVRSNAQHYEKEWPDGSHGWRRGLQSIAVMLSELKSEINWGIRD